jgi:hypothetical protein
VNYLVFPDLIYPYGLETQNNNVKKHHTFLAITLCITLSTCSINKYNANTNHKTISSQSHYANIDDAFWSPKLELWRTTTANDVLNKFEGQHLNEEDRNKNNVFENFDRVANGGKGAMPSLTENGKKGIK